jgi:hypothetical protein
MRQGPAPDGTLSNFNLNAPEIAAATGAWPARTSDRESDADRLAHGLNQAPVSRD